MFGGPTQLLNSCLKCGMKFDTAEQLATHQKKFCLDGDMNNLNQLEKNLFSSASKPSQPRESARDEYDKHYNKAVQDRERDMQKEIDRIKLDKASMRAKKQQEEEALADLIRDSEQRKEKDLRARIEREQIQKELVSLEKAKLSSLEQEKKTQLEKLAADRENLKQKEDHLMKEINRLEGDMKTMDRVRDEDIKRQDDALESFKRKGNENIKVNDLLLGEKSEKVAQLKVKREQLELERQKIMGDLEKVKTGDLTSLRRSNYGVFAANQMLKDMQGLKNYGIPEMREKIRQDENKLDHLKNNQKGIVTREHVYSDYPYASPPTNVDASYHLPRNSSVPAINKSLVHNNSMNQSASHFPRAGDILPDQSVLLSDQQIPLEFQKALNKKEFENERLKQELETIKVQNIKTDTAQSNLTLGEMQLRMNGIGSNPQNGFNMYAKTNEFFLQNEARSVDLNEDERMLLNLQAQEVDALRLISQIPIGTDLYRFKMEQYKELSTMRAEAEKIVQEQRLLKLRREFEKQRREEDRKYENEKWVDDQRKGVIATRLRKEVAPVQDNNRYDPVEGFVIHWDYALGIPKRHDSCQIVFGIYINGSEIIPPKLIEPHPCEVDTAVTNRCILGENYALNDIPANSNALVIFEVQILPSKDSTNPRVASYGWSQLDIFDSRRQLRKGKFKVPLYECPTNTNQDIDGIKNLVPVHDGISWIYIRISSPDDPDFDRSQILYPESTHMDYIIPQIHLRNFRPVETQFSQPYPQPMEMAKPVEHYQDPYDPYSRNPGLSRGQPQRPNNVESFYQPPKQHAKMALSSQNIEDMNQSTKINDTTMHNKSLHQGPKKAFQIIIHALRNHVARNNLRVSCALLEEADIVMDETGQACAFNSAVHDPNQNGRNATNLSMSTFAIKNKAQGDDIVFEESHKFMKEVDKLFKKSKGKKDLYLMFQVLEKPEPIQHGNSQSMSYKASNMSAYGKQLEYDLFGWLLFKLNKSDGTLSTGKFARNLFSTPLKKPPFDFSNERKTEAKLEFSVHEVEWNNNNNNNTSGQESDEDEEEKSEPRPKKQTTQKPKPKTHNRIDSFSDDNQMPNNASQQAFIQNTKAQFENKPFERGAGVDFYFDGCRGLPNNVTVTKATVQILDASLNALKSPESQLPEFTSPSYDPLFNFKIELRSNTVIAPTAIALISLSTIDEVSNQPKIIGYSAINLFISNSTKQQPKTNSEMGAILFSGNYQIPIYCQEPKRTQPFSFDDMTQLDRLPGASVIVRINNAPPSSQADPSKKPKSRPQYGTGAYNTTLYPMNNSELQLLDAQQRRQNMTVREVAQALLEGNNIKKNNVKNFSIPYFKLPQENEITTWLNEKIQFNPSLGFINMMYFAEYRSDLGFKFALDGIHNVPTAQPYIGLTMLNPPGGLYASPPDRGQVQIFNKIDWEGPLNSPRFANGFQYFRGIQPSKNLHMIIDIKAINLTKKAPQTSTIGWTILPLFTPDGYFMSGVYQVPLITGEVNQTIVSGLAASNSDPWEYILQQITQKKPLIKWLPNASVMVRLLDCQREGNLERVWDHTRVDSRYIPQNNLSKYIYSANADSKARQGKILKTIIPRKEDVFAFQEKIADTLVKELGL